MNIVEMHVIAIKVNTERDNLHHWGISHCQIVSWLTTIRNRLTEDPKSWPLYGEYKLKCEMRGIEYYNETLFNEYLDEVSERIEHDFIKQIKKDNPPQR